MSKDNLTSLLAIKLWNFYTILMQQTLIVFTYSHYSHLFL